MMTKVKVVMVGAGGFGNRYIEAFFHRIEPASFELVAIVDPFVEQAPSYSEIQERKIPVFDSLEEFYQQGTADLVFICSPVQFHMQQIRCAFNHRSHVMCEKPLTIFAEDVAILEKEAQEHQLLLGVGFQWNYAHQILLLKKHILEGRFGKILGIRTFISFRRNDKYYDSWHGHLYQTDGSLLLDSIISNATAHYLQLGLFLAGKKMDEAAMPISITGTLYRTKKIDSFDTCDVVCTLEDGIQHLNLFTHGSDGIRDIILFAVDLEEGTAEINPLTNENKHLIFKHKDGTRVDYDQETGFPDLMEDKLNAMIKAVSEVKEGKERPILPCHPSTTYSFALVCNSLFANLPIQNFAPEMIHHISEDEYGSFEGTVIPGLFQDFLDCYKRKKTPFALGKKWAIHDETYELSIEEDFKEKLIRKYCFD